ncbi:MULTISPECIES: Na+/H+ antiporter NhaA [Pseudomonas]|uniref:Na(+)/H(+) antiporter NhaA n=1 Tax=Pseudomonas beijingensis TaxID=2954101 RepID=A0ABY9F5H6_9PSED|nr:MULTISPECIES: Na+/H+ antiporter NhaA [unclassified Pseudomonas]WLG98705.1 Na+/H+ antiporter NhaA [Pseudomonas sp. FP2034]WLH49139.1 Na+/H+ antiporter NhaA [Pseudomonas sp. FP2262]WLI43837.1 Na+/H+ antiporter NhaA [Pseudomonas sp. FP830]
MGNTSTQGGNSRKATPLERFMQAESSGGIVLMLSALAALIVANSPLLPTYTGVLHSSFWGMSLEHWVNDALMAVFFLLVGLEIKREMQVGELAKWSQRALPGFAALGGMIVPALIYAWVNRNSAETLAGWAIPAATDIAFALGVLSLLGSRVPISLKVFLSALAILDDLGAVAIIAVFYTSGLDVAMLAASAAVIAVLFIMNRAGVTRLLPYLVLGVVLWVLVLKSGIHATLAGVALAFCIPLNKHLDEAQSPLLRLEQRLSPWVAFVVMPIFGFANAGVSLAGVSLSNLLDPVPLGVAAGLLLGKQIGVFTFALVAIKTGLAQMPTHSSWRQVYGVALLCGIGFTMSLFIGNLAFPGAQLLIDEVKVGVLAGSTLAALAGILVLRFCASSRT